MQILKARVNQVCPNKSCDFQSFENVTIDGNIGQMKWKLFPNRICAKCKSSMVIRSVRAVVRTTKYGNRLHGKWFCRFHPQFIYYSFPLQTADEHPLMAVQNYKPVVEGGYPWKCPICKRPLIYEDTKHGNSFSR